MDVSYESPAYNLKQAIASRYRNGLWRYHELLPVAEERFRVNIGAGGTPLVKAIRLGESIGIRNLYIKNDTTNPTYSFKDRPASVAISKAKEFGLGLVGCASTGNLASATAAHSAAAGLECLVLMPDTVELPKVRQATIYGSRVVLVNGTYDDVNRLAYLLVERTRIGIVNVNLRPYYVEGSKTMIYEIVEQLGWRFPENIVVPMASGALLGAFSKGLRELEEFGIIENSGTRFHGAQAVGCSPICDAFTEGSDEIRPVKNPETIVKSLAIGTPGDGSYALNVVRSSRGFCQAVPDRLTLEAMELLCKTTGIFAEPGGAITVAAVKMMRENGVLDAGDEVICCVTGSGFKVDEAVEQITGPTYVVSPKLSELMSVVGGQELLEK
ncbi:MAG: threonine synthase [Nitrososphaerota archaeon]